MTLDNGITLKVVARLSGSASDGASANFMTLQHVDFTVQFVEPEAAGACLNSKLALQDTEVSGGAARDADTVAELQLADIGSGAVSSLEVRWLKVRSSMEEDCKRHSVLEYWNKYACAEEMYMDSTTMEDGTMPMCEGAWIEVLDNDYVISNLEKDVMTTLVTFDQQYYL
jgi:hypothetical protein